MESLNMPRLVARVPESEFRHHTRVPRFLAFGVLGEEICQFPP